MLNQISLVNASHEFRQNFDAESPEEYREAKGEGASFASSKRRSNVGLMYMMQERNSGRNLLLMTICWVAVNMNY